MMFLLTQYFLFTTELKQDLAHISMFTFLMIIFYLSSVVIEGRGK